MLYVSRQHCPDLRDFLEQSPCCYHALGAPGTTSVCGGRGASCWLWRAWLCLISLQGWCVLGRGMSWDSGWAPRTLSAPAWAPAWQLTTPHLQAGSEAGRCGVDKRRVSLGQSSTRLDSDRVSSACSTAERGMVKPMVRLEQQPEYRWPESR